MGFKFGGRTAISFAWLNAHRKLEPAYHRLNVAGMADGFTIVGWLDDRRSVHAVVTHSGVTLGPLLGRLAAEEILDGAPRSFWRRSGPAGSERRGELSPRLRSSWNRAATEPIRRREQRECETGIRGMVGVQAHRFPA
jgi:glycine/D-amino acid oxidase-like deaminating enzyme